MATKQQWTIYHFMVFTLTFFSYAFFHATRKAFSNVKQTLEDEWTSSDLGNHTFVQNKIFNDRHFFDNKDDAELFLGALDSIFLFSYAIGLYISGVIGDRINLRKVLSFGMCSSALMVFMFGSVSKWAGIYSKAYYIIFWFLNGILQSTGWPCTVAIMGNWFGKSSRGFVFGLWSSCASVGNIIGAFMVSGVLDYGYEYAFFVPSVTLFVAGIVNYFCLLVTPAEVGLNPSDEVVPDKVRRDSYEDEDEPIIPSPKVVNKTEEKQSKAIGFCQAFLLPGVIPYALSYAFLKLVNYSFFFWLPLYLDQTFGWPETFSDQLSTFYDVGGIVSGTIAGFITDRLDSRAPTVLVMLFLAVPTLYIYSETGKNKTTNAAIMTATGVLIGGPANLISSAISADLGRQNALHDNSEALATVTGIIDGTGSVGAAIGQVLIPLIKTSFVKFGGWKIVFVFLMIMAFLSFMCIIFGILSRKFSEWRQKRRINNLVVEGEPPAEEHFTSSLPINSENENVSIAGAV